MQVQPDDFDDLRRLLEHLTKQLEALATTRTHLNTRQAAKRLGLSRYTISELCRRGAIAAEKKNARRGPHHEWSISMESILTYERYGKRRGSDG